MAFVLAISVGSGVVDIRAYGCRRWKVGVEMEGLIIM
jgi:hypothetical protein